MCNCSQFHLSVFVQLIFVEQNVIFSLFQTSTFLVSAAYQFHMYPLPAFHLPHIFHISFLPFLLSPSPSPPLPPFISLPLPSFIFLPFPPLFPSPSLLRLPPLRSLVSLPFPPPPFSLPLLSPLTSPWPPPVSSSPGCSSANAQIVTTCVALTHNSLYGFWRPATSNPRSAIIVKSTSTASSMH